MKILDHGFVELNSRTGHVGLATVNAARCSHGTLKEAIDDADRKLVRFLLGNGHTSPFRHAFFTFHIKAPLFVFRQWWKYQVGSTWREYETAGGDPLSLRRLVHAIDIQIDTDQGCSWNELSGRYKVLDSVFYVPEKVRKNTGKQAANEIMDTVESMMVQQAMTQHFEKCVELYEALLARDVAKELARLVLPPSIYSECYWTVSLQAVLHFLDQRLAQDAQFEIRQYAQGILELVRPSLNDMGIVK